MSTQKERLEEVEKTAKDLQSAVGLLAGKVDGLESSLGTVETTLATHSKQFAAILAKLDAMGGRSEGFPDGKKGSTDSTGETSDVQTGILPRMDLPPFDGTDPIAWLAQAEQYFLVHRTAMANRVQLALIAMSGKAMFWAQWVLRRAASIPWDQFTKELVERFGDSSAINAYEAMHLTRQTGSLEDYLSLFEERVAQLPSLPPEQYLGMFLGGLQTSIRDRLPDSEMTDVFAAIRAARRIARSSKSPAPPPRSNFPLGNSSRPTSTFQRSSANSGQAAVSPPARLPHSTTGPTNSPVFRNSRRLSPAQQEEYRAKGKCYRCALPYSPLYKCPAKSLAVLLEAEEDEPVVEGDGGWRQR